MAKVNRYDSLSELSWAYNDGMIIKAVNDCMTLKDVRPHKTKQNTYNRAEKYRFCR